MTTLPPAFRILLVEDEPAIRELVRSMLSDQSVSVDSVQSGEEGIRRARAQLFDLILLDVVLPKLDGISVCRILKSNENTASVPVYMLTAKGKKEDLEAASRAGAAGYIQKPFRGTELMELVDRLRQARV